MTSRHEDLALDDAFGSFSPSGYLREYYSAVGPENAALLDFLVESFARIRPGGRMLELGSGPTIYQLLAAAPVVRSIDIADRLPANLDAIGRWLDRAPDAFDWRPFVRATLLREGWPASDHDIATREALLRSKVRRRLSCDLFADQVLPGGDDGYDVVGLHFVAESITDDRGRWAAAIEGVARLVGPEGWLVTSALEGATHWRVGERQFPALSLDLDELVAEISGRGFRAEVVSRVDADEPDPASPAYEGYRGLMFVAALRTS